MNLTDGTVDKLGQQLLDRHEVADLVYRLGECLDEGRFDELRSLFVEEAIARTPGGTAEGREALVAQARRNHRPEDRIQHVTTNLLIDLKDDGGTVRANLVVHFAPLTDEAELPYEGAPMSKRFCGVMDAGMVCVQIR